MVLFALFIFNRLRVTQRQKKIIEEQKELVEEQKRDITDSIRYAENIQQALLPTIDDLNEALLDGFVLLQPKDIVSGDFYWLQHHKDKVYFAVCDCTGHGVPGAFMSMIGSSLLDEAVVEKGISQPNEIFYEVRKGFINALKQTGDTQKDGMDAALIAWDKGSTLQVAAAYNPVLIIRNGELREIKADRQPVGFLTGKQKEFTHHEVKLEKGDTVYIFSDGYPDQFGGPKGKKYKLAKFKKLLLSIQDKTMHEQKTLLEDTMAKWKGSIEQVDDILVMGVRF
jgi:serine phosphatase RsbU (regulator of sigma subunit)